MLLLPTVYTFTLRTYLDHKFFSQNEVETVRIKFVHILVHVVLDVRENDIEKRLFAENVQHADQVFVFFKFAEYREFAQYCGHVEIRIDYFLDRHDIVCPFVSAFHHDTVRPLADYFDWFVPIARVVRIFFLLTYF